MGELEPDDSRDVTNTTHHPPGGEIPTGAREDEARRRAGQQPRQEPAATDRATEGDGPDHPDRFADSIPEDEAREAPARADAGDRWHRAAERADAGAPDPDDPPVGNR